MLSLPGNCRAGNISVFPKNWKTSKANVNLVWRISYWFYDDNLQQKQQIVIKGMNLYKTLKKKQDAVEIIMNDELFQLQELGLNKILNRYSSSDDGDISKFTPFSQAIDYVVQRLHCVAKTRVDITNHMIHVKKAAAQLMIDRHPIRSIGRGELKLILEKVGVKSGNHYNHYRKYLSLIYRQLLEYGCVEVNYLRDIGKKPTHKKFRKTLTKEERVEVNSYLHGNEYEFWRLVQVFFHCGSRETEMMKVQREDIDLANQRFKVTVRKGRSSREEWRTIKTSVLYLWSELFAVSKDKDYIFSKGLKPGSVSISPSQVTRRWHRIKIKFGITADFYSLKHTNLDEISRKLGSKFASAAAGHSSTAVTKKYYLINEKEREHEELKQMDNAFA